MHSGMFWHTVTLKSPEHAPGAPPNMPAFTAVCHVVFVFVSDRFITMSKKSSTEFSSNFARNLESHAKTQQVTKSVYGEECVSCMWVYEWQKHFKDDCDSVESDKCSGQPATSRNEESIQEVWSAVSENHKITIIQLAEDLDMNFGSAESILAYDFGMRSIPTKSVPKNLPAEQKEAWLSPAKWLIGMCQK